MQPPTPIVVVTRPLSAHPQLENISTPLSSHRLPLTDGAAGSNVEYRVYNYRVSQNGRMKRGDGWSMSDMGITLSLVWMFWSYRLWNKAKGLYEHASEVRNGWSTEQVVLLAWLTSCILFTRYKCNTVLYESVTPLPGLGIQLASSRGISLPWAYSPHRRLLLPLTTSYTFIPLADISTVILNQALHRFSVRYYLGVVKKDGRGVVVPYSDVRPRFEVLLEVYHGVRETLFSEYNEC
ncbi:uncharacterized protein I303_106398 [Kwoniella dejecticola CBS 10117]|uniref:Phosphatidylinositol N-acetylglucosaminyltransferase subunit H conserved domain-containing protein n=1 Tax=Kwoniella dejecticola CBS 10117 TaxID=1296121 RepID=A0AAJ8KTV9_9TREE